MLRTATVALASAAFLMFAAPATAQTYEIETGQYTQGCLPPCLCPILLLGDVSGTFDLEFVAFDGSFAVYDLVDFEATVTNFVGSSFDLTAVGEYRVDELANEHELTLDITDVATGDVIPMNSGGPVPMPAGSEFPIIEIFIGTSLECFGTHLSMAASPVVGSNILRGDCNGDGSFDISDAVETLALLFVGGATDCPNQCDANDDEVLDISDAIYELAALFTAGAPLPPTPHPNCGADPSPGTLGCPVSTCP